MLRFVSYGLYCEQILAKCSKVFFLAVRNNSYWLHFSLRPSSDAVARKNYLALTGFPLFRQACFTASSRSVPIGQLHHASSYVTACSGFQLGLRMRRRVGGTQTVNCRKPFAGSGWSVRQQTVNIHPVRDGSVLRDCYR